MLLIYSIGNLLERFHKSSRRKEIEGISINTLTFAEEQSKGGWMLEKFKRPASIDQLRWSHTKAGLLTTMSYSKKLELIASNPKNHTNDTLNDFKPPWFSINRFKPHQELFQARKIFETLLQLQRQRRQHPKGNLNSTSLILHTSSKNNYTTIEKDSLMPFHIFKLIFLEIDDKKTVINFYLWFLNKNHVRTMVMHKSLRMDSFKLFPSLLVFQNKIYITSIITIFLKAAYLFLVSLCNLSLFLPKISFIPTEYIYTYISWEANSSIISNILWSSLKKRDS